VLRRAIATVTLVVLTPVSAAPASAFQSTGNPSPRSVLCIHVVNNAANPTYLRRVEAAALHVANDELRPTWNTPTVSFTSTGWTITLDPRDSGAAGGYHDVRHGRPRAVVLLGHTSRASWTDAFTHELLEMVVDPYTDRIYQQSPGHYGNIEVCDPVVLVRRAYHGVAIPDFVLPAWYSIGSGPWDYAHALRAARQVDAVQ
jgi:hypothetical protein